MPLYSLVNGDSGIHELLGRGPTPRVYDSINGKVLGLVVAGVPPVVLDVTGTIQGPR